LVAVFYKYEGAGNDFILLDDRSDTFPDQNHGLIRFLCDRRFGIGADGLMLLRNQAGYDFSMQYFNADGNLSSMCGNGGRCITAFANRLGIIQKKTRFIAVDGIHLAEMTAPDQVNLKMSDVSEVERGRDYFFLNTGSPHYVRFLPAIDTLDVFSEGRKVRYSKRFKGSGTNVNFVEDNGESIFVRTYERGVENETLACGTGVVASVICTALSRNVQDGLFSLPVKVMGGSLTVSIVKSGLKYSDVWLHGPATFVFQGTIDLNGRPLPAALS